VIRPLAVAAVAGALVCSAVVRAQAPPPSPSPSPAPSPSIRPFTLEVDVDVVSVTAVVHDKAGRFVRGLGPGDIEVYEDGVRQDVSYFREVSGPAAEKIPLSVVLVLDASGSMRNNMHFLQEAAITLVHRLEDVDSALVVDFNESTPFRTSGGERAPFPPPSRATPFGAGVNGTKVPNPNPSQMIPSAAGVRG